MKPPRLDLLIYAHDGRGLGHVSRSTAIGMAVRRLFPEKRVLLVTGCNQTGSLIGSAPLDWIKLPSYKTKVVEGKSKGIAGDSNYTDEESGRIRAETIRQLIALYHPRCVLADHSPQGKHKELLPALAESKNCDIRWVLGVRGVVGSVPQVGSALARKVFKTHYHAVLWYGDVGILGKVPGEDLERVFDLPVVETGYVSRLSELSRWQRIRPDSRPLAGTVSIPWIGEHTLGVISGIARAIGGIGDTFGPWRMFVGFGDNENQANYIHDLFKNLHFCAVEPASDIYIQALLNSKMAAIYGGYNSLTDILWANKPAVVLLRGMADQEQEDHLAALNTNGRAGLSVLSEKACTAGDLEKAFNRQLRMSSAKRRPINLEGAEHAATYLMEKTLSPANY